MLQTIAVVFVCLVVAGVIYESVTGSLFTYKYIANDITSAVQLSIAPRVLDKTLYNKKIIELANNPVPKIQIASTTQALLLSTTTLKTTSTLLSTSTPSIETLLANASATTSISIPGKPWPVSTVYPLYGALLPFNRIVAYYGNFYSKNMGVLGAYPTPQMLQMLMDEVAKWQNADPLTPVIPAIDYIAITAQASPGQDGMYRFRMPDDQIQKAIDLANEVHGIVFLDIQVGLSNLQTELPLLLPYLKLPNVHLAIDPEFSMKTGARPGTVIGTFDAADINYATDVLASAVKENNLPPKILVVHRFTGRMVTNYKNIKDVPEVQIVMDMDGWGSEARKKRTYLDVIHAEPVQFTGFKLFYKNDALPPSAGMMTPEQLLKLNPRPIYIQYQ